jgi:hypothetical protein
VPAVIIVILEAPAVKPWLNSVVSHVNNRFALGAID